MLIMLVLDDIFGCFVTKYRPFRARLKGRINARFGRLCVLKVFELNYCHRLCNLSAVTSDNTVSTQKMS